MDQRTKNDLRYLWQIITNATRLLRGVVSNYIILAILIFPLFYLLDWINRSNLSNNAKSVFTIVILLILLVLLVISLIKTITRYEKVKNQNQQELSKLQKEFYPNVVFKDYISYGVILLAVSILTIIFTIILLSK